MPLDPQNIPGWRRLARWPRTSLAGIAVVVASILWWSSTHRPEAQAQATFARLEHAVAAGDAAGVIDEIHPDYDFPAMWPRFFHVDEAKADADSPRTLARRGLALEFFQHREAPLVMEFQIRTIEPRDDGSVTVEATLAVGARNAPHPIIADDAPHRFVLARDTWWTGRLRIISHDVITAKR